MGRILVAFLFFGAQAVYSMDRSSCITDEEAARLKGGEIITEVYVKGNERLSTTGASVPGPPALPVTPHISPSWQSNELIVTEKAFFPGPLPAAKIARLLSRFSLLKGMQYYSHKRGAAEPLILDAYRSGPGGRVADQSIEVIAGCYSATFVMEDNRFGKLNYSSEIFLGDDLVAMVNTCVDPLKKFGVMIAPPGEYRTLSYLFRDGATGGWFLYSMTTAPVRNSFFLTLNIVSPKSFGNRLRGATVHLARGLGFERGDQLAAFR